MTLFCREPYICPICAVFFCRFRSEVTPSDTFRKHRVWWPSITSVVDCVRSRRTFACATLTSTVPSSTFYRTRSTSASLSEPHNDDQLRELCRIGLRLAFGNSVVEPTCSLHRLNMSLRKTSSLWGCLLESTVRYNKN